MAEQQFQFNFGQDKQNKIIFIQIVHPGGALNPFPLTVKDCRDLASAITAQADTINDPDPVKEASVNLDNVPSTPSIALESGVQSASRDS